MIHSTSCCTPFSWPCLAGLLFLCISAIQLNAQPSWDWAIGEGAGSEQEGHAVATDVNENAYVTGFLKNSVSFGSYNISAVGGEDIFICKYNAAGTVLWAIGDGGNGDEEGNGIAVDAAGNVYITGYFMGTATFSGSPNVVLTSYGAKDIFVAKYSSSGVLQWAKKAGSNGDDIGYGICTNGTAVFVTGGFRGNATFGSLTTTANGGEDVFIAAYDAATGTETWVRKGGGTPNDEGRGIAVDNSGVYAAGFFGNNTCTFQNQTGSLTSNGGEDIFLVKYDLSGNGLWTRRAGSSAMDHANAVSTNGSVVAISGYFGNTLSFYNSGPAVGTLANANGEDALVATFDAATGNYGWSRSENGNGVDRGTGIAILPNGQVYTCGYYNGTLPFGSGPSVTSNQEDPYASCYDAAGTFLWGKRASSTDNQNDEALGIAASSQSAQYVTGYFKSVPLTFDFNNISTSGNNDIFTARLECTLTIPNAGPDQTICSSTTTMAGNIAFFGTGTWSRISGTGTIVSPNSRNTSITGLSVGSNVFVWTIGSVSCGSNSDTVIITVDPNPTPANAGPDQTLCSSSATLAGNTISTGSGSWSLISGTGTVTSPNVPNSTVTGLSVGANVFRWTTSNGVCPSSFDNVTINVDANPTPANAGPDQTLCSSSSTLAGNTITTGSGSWALVSGTGTVVSPSSPNSAVNGLSVGANKFKWTSSNGTCPSSRDTVTINIDPNPTSPNAGPDQTLCSSSATLAGNTITVGSGMWSLVSGTGTVVSPGSPNSSVTGLSVGANVFQWRATNGTCPSVSDNVTINVDANPTQANAGPDQTLCSSSSVLAGNTITTGSGSWSLVSGTGTVVSPSSPNSAVNGLSVGANKFKWTSSNGTCPSSRDTVTINIDPNPTPPNAGPDQTLCSSSATLAGNTITTGSGTWSLISGSGTVVSPNSPNSAITGLSIGANVFQWTATNGTCPSVSDNVTINIDANPTPANAGTDQTICSSSSALAGNTIATGSGSWSLVSGTGIVVSPSQPNSAVSGLSVGANMFQWTSSNGTCPSSHDTVTINVDPTPTSPNAGPDQTLCSSSTTLAGNTISIGSGMWSLVSGTGTVVSPNAPNSAITGLSVGANVFQWTATNGTCPSVSDNVTINIDANPTPANAGTDQTICTSSSSLAGNTITTGSGTWSLVSGTGIVISPSQPNSAVSGLSVGANTFQWTSTNGTCPANSDTVTIFVDPNPSPAVAGPDQTICSAISLLAADTLLIGSGQWSLISGTGNFSNANAITTNVSGLSSGANTFQWTCTNGVCPASVDTVVIFVDDNPTPANAGADQLICSSSSTFSGNTVTTGSGLWTLLSGTGIILSPNSPAASVSNLSVGPNVFLWTCTNGVCPASIDTVKIQVDANPTAAIAGPDQQLCTSSAAVNGNLPSIGTGQWSLLSGSATIVSPSSAATNITNLSPGISVLQWTITNGVCPASSDQLTIQIDSMPDAANAGVDHLICDTNDTLSANIPVTGTGSWFAIGTTAVLGNPNNASSTVSNLASGSNFFEWVITNGVCPASHDTMEILYTPPPSPAVAGPDIAACGTDAVLSGQAPAIGQGHWTNLSGAGTFSDSTSATTAVSDLPEGNYYFTWTTTNSYCTSAPDTVLVSTFSPPSVAVAGTDQQLHTPFAQLDGNILYTGTGTWLVVAGNGVPENPNDPHTRVNNLSAGTNVFVWQASNGVCPTNADTVVIVREALVIPSGFSPNGDNTNDRFEITGLLEYNGVSLEVFNRWGNSVYRSDDYRNDWNGTATQGETLPDDIYYFLLDVPGDQTYSGYIAIKRTLQ